MYAARLGGIRGVVSVAFERCMAWWWFNCHGTRRWRLPPFDIGDSEFRSGMSHIGGGREPRCLSLVRRVGVWRLARLAGSLRSAGGPHYLLPTVCVRLWRLA